MLPNKQKIAGIINLIVKHTNAYNIGYEYRIIHWFIIFLNIGLSVPTSRIQFNISVVPMSFLIILNFIKLMIIYNNLKM